MSFDIPKIRSFTAWETREAINYRVRTHPLADLLGDLDHDRLTFALNPCEDGEMFVMLEEVKRPAIRLDSLGICLCFQTLVEVCW